jgi:cell division protein ZapA (FtsZ GTPase activity inhibitor)
VLDVGVTVAGTMVFVTGTAGTAEHLAAIAEVVGEVVPDREVHNEMTVEPLSLETDSAAGRIEPEHLR